MTNILNGKKLMNIAMDRILVSAVILSWNDLLRPAQRGLIQLEYVPGARRSYLKIWQLTGKAGGISLGVETRHEEKLPPFVGVLMIAAGACMMIASRSQSAH